MIEDSSAKALVSLDISQWSEKKVGEARRAVRENQYSYREFVQHLCGGSEKIAVWVLCIPKLAQNLRPRAFLPKTNGDRIGPMAVRHLAELPSRLQVMVMDNIKRGLDDAQQASAIAKVLSSRPRPADASFRSSLIRDYKFRAEAAPKSPNPVKTVGKPVVLTEEQRKWRDLMRSPTKAPVLTPQPPVTKLKPGEVFRLVPDAEFQEARQRELKRKADRPRPKALPPSRPRRTFLEDSTPGFSDGEIRELLEGKSSKRA